MKWVVRTGFVRVASSKSNRIYRSLEELPEELRERARTSLEGPLAQTILIADPEAYERLVDADEETPAGRESRRVPRRPGGKPRARGSDREWKVVLAAGITLILSLWAAWLWAIQSGM